MDYGWSLLKFLKVTLVVTSIYWCILLSVLVFLLLGQCSSPRSSDDSADALQTDLLAIVFMIVLSVCGGALVILLVAFHLLSQQYYKDSEHQSPNPFKPAHNHTEWAKLTITTPLTTFNPHFQRYANLNTLVPLLCERRLLQPSEVEHLIEHNQRSTQISCLLAMLDRKGPAGVSAVIDCLKQDESHLGHQDLAMILEKNY